jgi:hypothetical protein
MAEEPAMDFDTAAGFGAGDAEDNLSMPLGDFMAFLDSGSPGDDDDQQPEVSRFTPRARVSLCPNSPRFPQAGSPIR